MPRTERDRERRAMSSGAPLVICATMSISDALDRHVDGPELSALSSFKNDNHGRAGTAGCRTGQDGEERPLSSDRSLQVLRPRCRQLEFRGRGRMAEITISDGDFFRPSTLAWRIGASNGRGPGAKRGQRNMRQPLAAYNFPRNVERPPVRVRRQRGNKGADIGPPWAGIGHDPPIRGT